MLFYNILFQRFSVRVDACCAEIIRTSDYFPAVNRAIAIGVGTAFKTVNHAYCRNA